MIEIRQAETDADLEAWRQVRLAVLPDERALTVEEMRRVEEPGQLLLLAEVHGGVAGSGLAGRSSLAGHAGLAPRVAPAWRRRGVGTALMRALVAHARTLDVELLKVDVDGTDAESLAFARKFGFDEVDRQVEQVKTLADEPAPAFPESVELATIAERPELLQQAYELAVQGYADMATHVPVTITLEEWLRDEATVASASFVALARGEIVGYSGLMRDPDDPSRAEDGLTVVRRDWRRRGLAMALKRAELAAAARLGIREVYTWTQRGNEGMRAVNERLGYEYRHVALTMTAPLETVERALDARPLTPPTPSLH